MSRQRPARPAAGLVSPPPVSQARPGAVRPVSQLRAQRLGTHLVRPHGIRRAARGLAAGGCAGVGSLAGTGTWHARAERCAWGKVACKNGATRIAPRRRSSAIGRRPHISDLGTTEAARRRSVRLKPSSSDMNAASLQKTPARVVPGRRWLKCLLRPARHSTAPASKAALRPQQDERGINEPSSIKAASTLKGRRQAGTTSHGSVTRTQKHQAKPAGQAPLPKIS